MTMSSRSGSTGTRPGHTSTRVGGDHRQSVVDALGGMVGVPELMALGGLTVIYAAVSTFQIEALYVALNILGPFALMLILGLACLRMLDVSSLAIWAPLFWFRVACLTYYGLGATVPYIGSESTRLFMLALYRFSDASALKVNLLCAAGIFVTLMFSYLFLTIQRKLMRREIQLRNAPPNRSMPTLPFAVAFLAIGSFLKYALIVPYTFGLSNSMLPGYILTLGNVYYVGIFLLLSQALRSGGILVFAAAALIFIEVIISVSSFSKTDLLFILMFSSLAFITHKADRRTLLTSLGLIATVYTLFQPMVTYGREAIYDRYGQIRGAGVGERLLIAQDFFKYGLPEGRDALALARLSYMSVNAFAVDRYDAGSPGHTLDDAAAVFVPRILWPDKPIITRQGLELNRLIVGRGGSSLGLGHFAEAYWNFGWWGFAPLMAILALIMSLYSSVSLGIMARGDWLMLPVVFIGVNLGIRVDGNFVVDVVGQTWMAVVLGTSLWCIRSLIPAAMSSLGRNVPSGSVTRLTRRSRW
jgi:hypothetical protein